METALLDLVTPETAGDPMGQRKWVRSSLRQLRHGLAQAGYAASAPTVSRLLKKHDDGLRLNVKAKEAGSQPPERETPCHHLEAQTEAFAAAGSPIISVDTKTKELSGDFKNAGQTWCQRPIEVNVHDFPSDALGRAVPDGSYDVQRHVGAVYVGASAATPELAVMAIAHWWEDIGGSTDPQAKDLLILADAGGSHGCRPRLWTEPLQRQLCDRLGLSVTVCHYPPGCSKWNPSEPRLFSHMSLHWAGQPLRTLETMLSYVRGTTTATGLRVTASLLEDVYETGKRVADAVMKTLQVEHDVVCPQWNYTIRPRLRGTLAT
jgi:Rhodopirellula transposase DDE domain